MATENTPWGFRWPIADDSGASALSVERWAGVSGSRRVIGVTTDTQSVDIYVSRRGRIRVFKDGVELKAVRELKARA